MGLKNIQSLLTEQPESGGAGPGTSMTVVKTTRIYKFTSIYRDTIVLELGIGSEGNSDQGLEEKDGWITDWAIEAAVGYSILTCQFTNTVGIQFLPSVRKLTNKPFYSMTRSPGNLPLEQLSNFETRWIYDLSAIDGTLIGSLPAWWETATDTTIPVGDEVTFKWVKDTSQSQTGWFILKEKTKKGATEKQNSNAIVQETIWTELKTKALELINQTTRVKDPGETFGLPGQFLQLPSNMVPDGDIWKIETSYLNADTWDEDIYGEEVT
jgi:hypothetical protein